MDCSLSASETAGTATPSGGVYIKQAAKIVGVSNSVLRTWESEGLIAPARTASGYRVYGPQDVERLRRIRDLILGEGLNPSGVRRVLDGGEKKRGRAPRAHVHERIQALRKRKGISLRALASMSGLSASTVSAIERGVSAPSVATLQRLAAALETTVPKLLDAPRPQRQLVVRAHERPVVEPETTGVLVEQLHAAETTLQSMLISVEPGHGGREAQIHEGEVFFYVLDGQLELTLDELDTYRLDQMDAITFATTRPHRWHNPGDEQTVVICIRTPPTS